MDGSRRPRGLGIIKKLMVVMEDFYWKGKVLPNTLEWRRRVERQLANRKGEEQRKANEVQKYKVIKIKRVQKAWEVLWRVKWQA